MHPMKFYLFLPVFADRAEGLLKRLQTEQLAQQLVTGEQRGAAFIDELVNQLQDNGVGLSCYLAETTMALTRVLEARDVVIAVKQALVSDWISVWTYPGHVTSGSFTAESWLDQFNALRLKLGLDLLDNPEALWLEKTWLDARFAGHTVAAASVQPLTSGSLREAGRHYQQQLFGLLNHKSAQELNFRPIHQTIGEVSTLLPDTAGLYARIFWHVLQLLHAAPMVSLPASLLKFFSSLEKLIRKGEIPEADQLVDLMQFGVRQSRQPLHAESTDEAIAGAEASTGIFNTVQPYVYVDQHEPEAFSLPLDHVLEQLAEIIRTAEDDIDEARQQFDQVRYIIGLSGWDHWDELLSTLGEELVLLADNPVLSAHNIMVSFGQLYDSAERLAEGLNIIFPIGVKKGWSDTFELAYDELHAFAANAPTRVQLQKWFVSLYDRLSVLPGELVLPELVSLREILELFLYHLKELGAYTEQIQVEVERTRHLLELFQGVNYFYERQIHNRHLLSCIRQTVRRPAQTFDAFTLADQFEVTAAEPVSEKELVKPDPAKLAPEAAVISSASPALLPENDYSFDDEIVAIFGEEFDECCEFVTLALASETSEILPAQTTIEVRRAFHTIKGSGRMVGASQVAEISWKIEDLLNHYISGALPVQPHTQALLKYALVLMQRLLLLFKNHEELNGWSGSESVITTFLNTLHVFHQPTATRDVLKTAVSHLLPPDGQPEVAEKSGTEGLSAPEPDQLYVGAMSNNRLPEPLFTGTTQIIEATQGDGLPAGDASAGVRVEGLLPDPSLKLLQHKSILLTGEFLSVAEFAPAESRFFPANRTPEKAELAASTPGIPGWDDSVLPASLEMYDKPVTGLLEAPVLVSDEECAADLLAAGLVSVEPAAGSEDGNAEKFGLQDSEIQQIYREEVAKTLEDIHQHYIHWTIEPDNTDLIAKMAYASEILAETALAVSAGRMQHMAQTLESYFSTLKTVPEAGETSDIEAVGEALARLYEVSQDSPDPVAGDEGQHDRTDDSLILQTLAEAVERLKNSMRHSQLANTGDEDGAVPESASDTGSTVLPDLGQTGNSLFSAQEAARLELIQLSLAHLFLAADNLPEQMDEAGMDELSGLEQELHEIVRVSANGHYTVIHELAEKLELVLLLVQKAFFEQAHSKLKFQFYPRQLLRMALEQLIFYFDEIAAGLPVAANRTLLNDLDEALLKNLWFEAPHVEEAGMVADPLTIPAGMDVSVTGGVAPSATPLNTISGTLLFPVVDAVLASTTGPAPAATPGEIVSLAKQTTGSDFYAGLDQDLMEIFMEEGVEIMEQVEAQWQGFSEHGTVDSLYALQRHIHTLKGAARMCGVYPVGELAHAVENLYEKISFDKRPGTPAELKLLRKVHDDLASQLEALTCHRPVDLFNEEIGLLNRYVKSLDPQEIDTYFTRHADGGFLPAGDSQSTSDPVFGPALFAPDVLAGVQAGDQKKNPFLTPAPTLSTSPEAVSVIPQRVHEHKNSGDELKSIFFQEALGLVEEAQTGLHHWQHSPSIEILRNLLRGLHTLKGGARIMEDNDLAPVIHALEARVQFIAGQDVNQCSQRIIDDLKDIYDWIEDHLLALEASQPGVELDEVIQSLARIDSDLANKYQAYTAGEMQEASPLEEKIRQTLQEARKPLTDADSLNVLVGQLSERQFRQNLTRSFPSVMTGEADMAAGTPQSKPASTIQQARFSVIPAQKKTVAGMLPWVTTRPVAGMNISPSGSVPASQPGEEPPSMMGEFGTEAEKDAASEVLRVSSGLMENLINLSGETAITRARLEVETTALAGVVEELGSTVYRLSEQLRRMEGELESQIIARHHSEGNRYSDFDPLEMDQYSALNQLSKSLSESSSDLLDYKSTLVQRIRNTESLLQEQQRLQIELQQGLMSSRLVPFSRVVPRLERLVRQTALELDKKVEIEFINENLELDKTILDRLVAPVEHILRNGVDHGIEKSTRRRRELGKPESGTIQISLARENNEIVIRIKDDGRGLDLEAIRKKAVERGMVPADIVLTDAEIAQYIFHSGLSTAEKLSHISGRGVGLDVVQHDVRAMGGRVQIETVRDMGSTFVLYFPLSLSIVEALVVRSGDQSFAIPLSQIEQLSLYRYQDLKPYYTGQKDADHFMLDGESYKLRALSDLLEIEAGETPSVQKQSVPLLGVKHAGQRLVVQVDQITGSRVEIIVKPLHRQLASISGISGASIMGDGSVMLVLDLSGLAIRAPSIQYHHPAHSRHTVFLPKVRTVLVVDDSVTVRKVTSRLLERNGYRALTAKDGQEALEVMAGQKVDLVLLDVEMPQMDGFEVASQMRHDERLRSIPVIMITSRTGEKHRDRAMSIGVNAYMGKPYQEQDLLAEMERLMKATV